jgi:hypothetical protein
VIVVGVTVAVWWPAFTLGAWGQLFFDQLLTVWVAATAAFVVVLLQPRGRGRRWWKAVVLLVPSVWLVLHFYAQDHSDFGDFGRAVLALISVAVAILGIPFTIWVLVRIMWPDFGVDIGRVRRVIALAAVAAVAVGCFVLGLNQARFLTCEDFVISGNSEPPGCVHRGTPSTSPTPEATPAR